MQCTQSSYHILKEKQDGQEGFLRILKPTSFMQTKIITTLPVYSLAPHLGYTFHNDTLTDT